MHPLTYNYAAAFTACPTLSRYWGHGEEPVPFLRVEVGKPSLAQTSDLLSGLCTKGVGPELGSLNWADPAQEFLGPGVLGHEVVRDKS